MSTEEDTELRDLLQQTLENNGSLAKIRAQLRACVFMAFDEDEKIQSQQPLINKKIKAQLEHPEGQLLFGLVHEFLEYYNMDYTLSVYKSEAYLDSAFSYSGRNKLLKELQLKVNESVPVLLQLLRNTLSNLVPKSNGVDERMNRSVEDENPKMPFLNQTFDIPNNDSKNNTPRSATSDGKDDTYEGTSSIAEDSFKEKTISTEPNEEFIDHSEKSNSTIHRSLSPVKLDLVDKYVEKSEKSSIKPDKYKSKSPRSTLPDINAPLQANKSRDFVLPSLYNSNQGFYDNLDNYEEDFMSTSDADIKSEQSHHTLNSIHLNKTQIKEISSLNADKETNLHYNTNDSIASSVTSEDFELNSTVDDILKSNSN